jgi:hypothetical protein
LSLGSYKMAGRNTVTNNRRRPTHVNAQTNANKAIIVFACVVAPEEQPPKLPVGCEAPCLGWLAHKHYCRDSSSKSATAAPLRPLPRRTRESRSAGSEGDCGLHRNMRATTFLRRFQRLTSVSCAHCSCRLSRKGEISSHRCPERGGAGRRHAAAIAGPASIVFSQAGLKFVVSGKCLQQSRTAQRKQSKPLCAFLQFPTHRKRA